LTHSAISVEDEAHILSLPALYWVHRKETHT